MKVEKTHEGYFKLVASYKKESGGWAWIIHRISGLALTAYLYVHIYALSTLTKGKEAFDAEMALFQKPLFKLLEWLLFAFVLAHTLNGIRIVLVDFGKGAYYHKKAFAYLMIIGIIAFLVMGYFIFSHEIGQIFAGLI
ncbi:succinate dehydrogenase, cytochrome b556 subunit [Candidatus Kryptobacter tengchongensis]|uniref:Succinate dehydrogenase cytochrome b556 subunit n=1 Tax=Kryptobacter tengchongensis TaxID=1643429 RepID=A0A916PCF2_KRYT1|nr:succinate dehydrogenase, cytochrome b556 subunit [Candidatus Kryptobacter tengchongensis]CUT04101.1 succinate dehydrogenase subunit C [Candidatus Kryptobacter tengchongensis]